MFFDIFVLNSVDLNSKLVCIIYVGDGKYWVILFGLDILIKVKVVVYLIVYELGDEKKVIKIIFFLVSKEIDLLLIYKLVWVIDILLGDCMSVVCNDDNDCMIDVCNDEIGECVYIVISGMICNDKNSCIVVDFCVVGVCIGIGIVFVCDCLINIDCVVKEDGNLCNGILVCMDN